MTIEEEMLLEDLKENVEHWLINQIQYNTDYLSDSLFDWCTGLEENEIKFIDNYFERNPVSDFVTDIDIEIKENK